MQLTQLNSVYSNSTRSIQLLTIRVRVMERTQVFAIYQPATFISWEMISSAAAFFTRSLKALVDTSYNRHVFFHNSINFFFKFFTPKFYLPANSSKHVIWPHDLQTESTRSRRSELIGNNCSRCERVDNSTSSWVELCRYKRASTRLGRWWTFWTYNMNFIQTYFDWILFAVQKL